MKQNSTFVFLDTLCCVVPRVHTLKKSSGDGWLLEQQCLEWVCIMSHLIEASSLFPVSISAWVVSAFYHACIRTHYHTHTLHLHGYHYQHQFWKVLCWISVWECAISFMVWFWEYIVLFGWVFSASGRDEPHPRHPRQVYSHRPPFPAGDRDRNGLCSSS